MGKKVRGLPIHLGTVGVGAIVLFLPPRLVWVLGHGVCTTGTVGAGACKQNSPRFTRKKIRKTRQKDRIAVGHLS